jgi:hypothetical protein
MSTAEDEARQMIADKKAAAAAEKAYNAASSTPPAPAKTAAPAKPQRSAAVQEAIQEMEDEKARKKIKAMGYAKGGSVSASRRADGIAQRGKTRGKFC